MQMLPILSLPGCHEEERCVTNWTKVFFWLPFNLFSLHFFLSSFSSNVWFTLDCIVASKTWTKNTRFLFDSIQFLFLFGASSSSFLQSCSFSSQFLAVFLYWFPGRWNKSQEKSSTGNAVQQLCLFSFPFFSSLFPDPSQDIKRKSLLKMKFVLSPSSFTVFFYPSAPHSKDLKRRRTNQHSLFFVSNGNERLQWLTRRREKKSEEERRREKKRKWNRMTLPSLSSLVHFV